MASESTTTDRDTSSESAGRLAEFPENARQSGETGLLIEAFRTFTLASNSLELTFSQLQSRVRRLTEELEAKNRELERSLREKQEAQEYLRTILEKLPCGVFVLEETGAMTLCNPMAAEVLRESRGEAGRFRSDELRNLFTASAEEKREEMEITLAAGGEKKVLATSGAPLEDDRGRSLGTLHIIRDVTEVKALEEKNQRGERLAAMGEMAAELAHEIRNPLGSIDLFASLLMRECTGDLRNWAENIRIGARSLNTIVSNMLHFTGPLSPVFAEMDIHEILRETGSFCEPMIRQRGVRWEIGLAADCSLINGDRELIKQLVLNLIFNAMKAMPSEGSLAVRTRNVDGKNRRRLELRVEDTGVGITPEHLDKIFDPFFTTNKNGTGLGLSIVNQIVESHSGEIRVKSKVNRGTVFTILFDTI
ncbi:MAG: PAS domain-containing protein [Acidobacteriota bacterium]|jgi:signal transduction histidine kinase|nr:PAS domain-containing protein [Acidobacteriota bacterium]